MGNAHNGIRILIGELGDAPQALLRPLLLRNVAGDGGNSHHPAAGIHNWGGGKGDRHPAAVLSRALGLKVGNLFPPVDRFKDSRFLVAMLGR